MYFPSGPSPNRYVRPSPSNRRDSGPIYAVGHSATVAAPAGGASAVTLMNVLATVAHGTVTHGARVEILAWQPAGPNGTRYRVRSFNEGLEGWLSGQHLQACTPTSVTRPRRTTTVTKTTTPAKRAVGRK